jgi:glycosyltransferase involved in cell wall biosynthesis
MAHGPSIGVIVPNYNDSRYIARCLRSVLDQPVPPDELVVVDDGSTDGSVELIRSLIAGESRAQLVVHDRNRGIVEALHSGLAMVRSEYILFLAANDAVLPGIFARAKRCLAEHPGAGLWSAMAWLMDEDGRPLRLQLAAVPAFVDTFFPPERCVRLAHRVDHWFTGTTLVFHREKLQELGGFDPTLGAACDTLAALALSTRWGAAYSPQPFAAIRLHRGSFSSTWAKEVDAVEAMIRRLREKGPRLSPGLFTRSYLERAEMRYFFASVRWSNGASIPEVAARVFGWKRLALLALHRFVPGTVKSVRIAFAFAILRPFDILWTVWYRILCVFWVRLSVSFPGAENGS